MAITELAIARERMQAIWRRQKPAVIKTFWDIMEDRIERNIVEPIHPKYEKGALEAFDAAIQTGEYILFFVVAPHDGHINGVQLAKVTEYLLARANSQLSPEKQIKSAVLPIASTIDSGSQGAFLQEGFRRFKRSVTKRGVELVEHTRPGKDEDDKRQEDRTALIKTIMKAVDQNKALALLPEASVQAGRRRPEAKHWYDINGLQHFKEGAVDLFIRIIHNKGKKALIIPVIPDGGFRVQDVNNSGITPKGVVALASPFPLELLEVRVGMSIDSRELYKELEEEDGTVDPVAVDTRLEMTAASYTPPPRRGVWRGIVK